MKRLITFAALVPFTFAMVLAVACGSDDKTDAEARQDYIADAEEELSKVDDRISDLETEVSKNNDTDLRNELEAVKDERQDLENALANLRTSNDDNWEAAREDVDQALDDLDERIDTLVSDIADQLDPVAPGQGGSD